MERGVGLRPTLGLVVLLLAVGAAGADVLPATPLTQDPLGPISDVTATWEDYQPRDAFCVYPDVVQYPGPAESAVFTGADADCAASSFARDEAGLVKITVGAPALCDGCRRLFIDYSVIPANEPPVLYAHGHAYLHLGALDPTVTVHPKAHSPNIKNLTNDKLFVPDDAIYRRLVHAFDTRTRAYAGNTAHFVHNRVQGPYYVGPWYVNGAGARVRGAYLDVLIDPASAVPPETHQIYEVGYAAGFHSGEEICFDEIVGEPYRDGDAYYGGCIDAFGAGRTLLDPWSGT